MTPRCIVSGGLWKSLDACVPNPLEDSVLRRQHRHWSCSPAPMDLRQHGGRGDKHSAGVPGAVPSHGQQEVSGTEGLRFWLERVCRGSCLCSSQRVQFAWPVGWAKRRCCLGDCPHSFLEDGSVLWYQARGHERHRLGGSWCPARPRSCPSLGRCRRTACRAALCGAPVPPTVVLGPACALVRVALSRSRAAGCVERPGFCGQFCAGDLVVVPAGAPGVGAVHTSALVRGQYRPVREWRTPCNSCLAPRCLSPQQSLSQSPGPLWTSSQHVAFLHVDLFHQLCFS